MKKNIFLLSVLLAVFTFVPATTSFGQINMEGMNVMCEDDSTLTELCWTGDPNKGIVCMDEDENVYIPTEDKDGDGINDCEGEDTEIEITEENCTSFISDVSKEPVCEPVKSCERNGWTTRGWDGKNTSGDLCCFYQIEYRCVPKSLH